MKEPRNAGVVRHPSWDGQRPNKGRWLGFGFEASVVGHRHSISDKADIHILTSHQATSSALSPSLSA